MTMINSNELKQASIITDDKKLAKESEAEGYSLKNVDLGDVDVEKDFSEEVKPNAYCILSICVVMSGTLMFGADTTLFGAIQSVTSFVEKFCVGNYGTAAECGVADCDIQLQSHPLCSGLTSADACCNTVRANNSQWVSVFLMLGNFLLYFGAAWGALFLGPFLAKRWGRRLPVFIGCIIAIIGCLFQAILNFSSQEVFLAARFVLGFGAGTALCILPMYNAEVAVPQWRGITGGLFQFFVVIAGFIAVILTKFITNYQVILMIPAMAAALPLVGVFLIPESPRFVMKKFGYEKGYEILQKLRASDASGEAKEIFLALEAEATVEKVSFTQLFSNPSTRKRVLIAVMFQIVQQFSGVNMILGYFGTLISQVAPDFDPFTASIIYQACFVVGSFIGVASLDFRYGGRRIQTLLGLAICTVAYLISATTLAVDGNGYIALVGIFLFGFGFQVSIGIMPWLYPSEIFTMEERENALAVTVWVQYIASAIIVVISSYMIDWSVYGTFYIFFGLCILWFVWAFVFVKETRGVHLENIPDLFL